MIPQYILDVIEKDDSLFSQGTREDFKIPEYNPNLHYLQISNNNYFSALICLRSYIKLISDYYFTSVVEAKNVDLFMLTSSVSSPMGPGSNSEAIEIKFGNIDSYLVDSSQFGFEPLLLNGLDKVYCYMPSMRGENPDKRHLNQFFHCEMEMKGSLEDIKGVVEGYVKIMCETILKADNIIRLISKDYKKTKEILENVVVLDSFENSSFDEAVTLLEKAGKSNLVNYTDYGRDISAKGELEFLKILKTNLPVWINNFDRDRVPFYQKPCEDNDNKVINADLLFPPIKNGSFGGEIVGGGQRQNDTKSMYESLSRQNVSPDPYAWYIDLRRQEKYRLSAGFGLGIERFISWALGLEDIKDAIIYPRLKNIISYP